MYYVPPPKECDFKYKCVYKGGKEVKVSSDFDSTSFIRIEMKSPDLVEIWKMKVISESSETWEKIYPRGSFY